MYLGIRTDAPDVSFHLYVGAQSVAMKSWHADRTLARRLLAELEQFLGDNEASFSDIKGLFAYKGPGSFTGLRIGLTVLNTIAYANALPIVGSTGSDWERAAVKRLMTRETDGFVMPDYGAEPRITRPRS